MSPLELLRTVCAALVARGDAAVIDGAHLYVGETPVALATRTEVVVRGVLGAGDRFVLAPARRAVQGRTTAAGILALIDEHRVARAAQEVPCAA